MEYWYARELKLVLNYKECRKFENVIQKAIKLCKNSNINTLDHFVGVDKMVFVRIKKIIWKKIEFKYVFYLYLFDYYYVIILITRWL